MIFLTTCILAVTVTVNSHELLPHELHSEKGETFCQCVSMRILVYDPDLSCGETDTNRTGHIQFFAVGLLSLDVGCNSKQGAHSSSYRGRCLEQAESSDTPAY